MKNILVKSLFEIGSTDWEFRKRDEENLYDKYVESHQISVGSYKKFLRGNWEFKFIGGKFDTIHQAFHHTFFEIYKIWKENAPCNILYTDPDTLAVKPVDIWGQYNNFMMFNYTDPRSYDGKNRYGKKFDNFFNAGVRYFPATMTQETWDIGIAMANDWDFDSYDTEQIILNEMLWSQGISVEQALQPQLAYQAAWMPNASIDDHNAWNGTSISNCSIIHFHSSRNVDVKLAIMRDLDRSTQPPPDMKPVFENIIKNRLWRDVPCGSGSTIPNTQSVRDQLVPFLQRHNINSMADIPCGDYSWMSLVKFPDTFQYIGGDIVGFMVEENRKKYPGVDFREFDLSQDTLPNVDLLFCRDCLFHFSLADLRVTLANISRSNVKYVMITTYDGGNNQDIKTGGFRPLDFTQAPFNLPQPIDAIVENIEGEQPRKIALWPIDAIKRCVF